MATKQQNNEEEVDLGSLFVIIGKGFSNLFNFIGNLFKSIFHFFIIDFTFFKRTSCQNCNCSSTWFYCGFFYRDENSKKVYVRLALTAQL